MGGHRRVAVLLALAVVLAGCSSGGPAAPPAPPTPSRTPQELAADWTGAVCGALVPVLGRLTRPPAFDLRAPEATRAAYGTYLAEGIAETDRARATLAAAGPAPVPDGDQIAEQVRGDVADLRASLVDAKQQVDGADPADPISLGRTLVGVGHLVGALLSSAEVVRTLNGSPALRDAYARTPACGQLQHAVAPATTPVPAPPT
jgi:hypothetical protein